MLYGLGVLGIMHFSYCMLCVLCVVYITCVLYDLLHATWLLYILYLVSYCTVYTGVLCAIGIVCIECETLQVFCVIWVYYVNFVLRMYCPCCVLYGSCMKNMLCVHWMWVMCFMCIEYTASMLPTLVVLCHFVRIVYIVGCVVSTVCVACNIHRMYAVSHIYVACFVLY